MTPKKIILHCSASNFGDARLITKWHTDPKPKGNGWQGIGYHYVVLNGRRTAGSKYKQSDDGIVEKGRSNEHRGAHVRGQNKDSLGICVIGKHHFTANQILIAVPKLLRELMDMYGLGWADVYGHYQFTDLKSCPNIPMKRYLSLISKFKEVL